MKRIILVCGLLLFTSACDRKHESATESGAKSWLKSCPDFSVTGKAPVETNAQCGSFEVKEDPQNPDSKTIMLNVLRLPAINPVPEKDPLFVIAGGPGQSAVVMADNIHYTFNEVRKNRDIIFVDQRGTGKSNPFKCDFENISYENLPPAQQEEMQRSAVKQCINTYGDQFNFYTTAYAVADLDALRLAMGYERINLWGGSYGTRVVLEYMRRFPARTRAAVLDGVAPAAIALPWFMEEDGLASLQKINAQCQAEKECQQAYGDIVEKANQVSQRLLVKPEVIKFANPRTQAPVSANLTAQDFAGLIRLALYNRDLSSLVPQVISQAASGNYQLIGSLMYLVKAKNELADINYGMHFAVVCNEDYPFYEHKSAAESNKFLQAELVQKYADVCKQWPRSAAVADYSQPVKSDAPVLILSGAIDPVTPPRWGELIKKDLSNAIHVVAPGGHHIITQEGCVSQLIGLFLMQDKSKPLDTSCANNIKPLKLYRLPEASLEPAKELP